MKKIRLECTAGPFGDCTAAYKVYFPKGITVEEFINLVLEENPDEWGSFHLGSLMGTVIGNYNRSKENKFTPQNIEVYEKIKHFHPVEIFANGGWSLMDYTIITKEKNPNDFLYMTITEEEALKDIPVISKDKIEEAKKEVSEKFYPASIAELKRYAYWDWCDGPHFCSECGFDALYDCEGKEFCSPRCPHCGAIMTYVEDQI